MDLKQPPPRHDHDQAGAQATLGRSLRPVRVVLSAAFVAVVLTTPGQDVVTLGRDATYFLAVLGALNGIVNVARILGFVGDERRRSMAVQILADAVIAMSAMILLDASATPLAWVALLLPVFDAGVAFGAMGSAVAWAGLSLAYVAIRLEVDPPGQSADANVLGLALQQLAAVAVVAIPTAYVAARLRDDLGISHRARRESSRRADELLVVAAAAQRLATTTDAVKVLEIALDCVVGLGFVRADVCEKHGDREWRLLRAAGAHPGPPLDSRLDNALEHDGALVFGAGATLDDPEELRLLGYSAGAMLPVTTSKGYAIVLRAWSSEALTSDSPALESVKLVASLTAGAWQNATTLSDLESWSLELTRRATHDELTGLANRPHLFASVETSLDRMRNAGTPFAALFLDLDGFKEVNDELGHDAGDAVLQGIAERLRQKVRGHDVLARLGGDEFVVILNDLEDHDQATLIAGRICEAASAPFSIGGKMVTLAASIGIAHARPDDTADSVLNNADRLMYEAKRQGGNRFAVHPNGET